MNMNNCKLTINTMTKKTREQAGKNQRTTLGEGILGRNKEIKTRNEGN